MSDDSSRNLSSRVFHIDRECYVVYVGTSDHRFRPFLRLGTSPRLPEKVKRHVSNVVISDHLTGNPQYERQCLEQPVSHDMRYVGTTSLVNSIKQFVHDQTIASRPISPPKDEEAEREGAHVLFYSDGNVRIIVDGKEVLDLSKRERSDRHGVFEFRRLNEFARSSSGSYFASAFTLPGFLYSDDGSLFFFKEESLEVRRLAAGGLDELTRRLIPLDLIHHMAGPVDRESFVDLCKWRLREKKDLAVASPEESEASAEIEELLTLLSKAGLQVSREPSKLPTSPLSEITRSLNAKDAQIHLQDGPKVPNSPALSLPEGISWLGEVSPGLLPGMPYQLAAKEKRQLDKPERDTLHGLLTDALKKEFPLPEEPISAKEVEQIRQLLKNGSHATSEEPGADLLIGHLLLWNLTTETLWKAGENGELSKGMATIAETLQKEWSLLKGVVPLPVNATIFPREATYAVTFSLPPGFTKGRISENRRVLQKIDAFIDRREENSYYKAERERLETFLGTLIEKQKVAPVSAPKAKKVDESPNKDEGAGVESGSTEVDRRGVAEKSGPGTGTTKSSSTRSGRAKSGVSGDRQGSAKEERSGRKGWIWAAAAILLLGGAGVLIYFGLGADDAATVRNAEETQEASGSTGPGVDGADASAPGDDAAAAGSDGSGESLGEDDSAVSQTGEPGNGDMAESAAGSGSDGGSSEESPSADGGDSVNPQDEVVGIGNGGFEVTVLDVLLFVNRVARDNGFEPIGAVSPNGRDPDWIFPGSTIELPDGTIHTVERGETLWGISRRFLLNNVNEHHRRFLALQQEAEAGATPVTELQNLREEVYVESLREAITDFLESL